MKTPKSKIKNNEPQFTPKEIEDALFTMAKKVLSNFKATETQLTEMEKRLTELEKKVREFTNSWLL